MDPVGKISGWVPAGSSEIPGLISMFQRNMEGDLGACLRENLPPRVILEFY